MKFSKFLFSSSLFLIVFLASSKDLFSAYCEASPPSTHTDASGTVWTVERDMACSHITGTGQRRRSCSIRPESSLAVTRVIISESQKGDEKQQSAQVFLRSPNKSLEEALTNPDALGIYALNHYMSGEGITPAKFLEVFVAQGLLDEAMVKYLLSLFDTPVTHEERLPSLTGKGPCPTDEAAGPTWFPIGPYTELS